MRSRQSSWRRWVRRVLLRGRSGSSRRLRTRARLRTASREAGACFYYVRDRSLGSYADACKTAEHWRRRVRRVVLRERLGSSRRLRARVRLPVVSREARAWFYYVQDASLGSYADACKTAEHWRRRVRRVVLRRRSGSFRRLRTRARLPAMSREARAWFYYVQDASLGSYADACKTAEHWRRRVRRVVLRGRSGSFQRLRARARLLVVSREARA